MTCNRNKQRPPSIFHTEAAAWIKAQVLWVMLIAWSPIAQAGNLEHPSPGTSLVRFGQLDKGVFKGSKPHPMPISRIFNPNTSKLF